MLRIRKNLKYKNHQNHPSPLVFLDINEFKNKNNRKNVKKSLLHEKVQYKTMKSYKIETQNLKINQNLKYYIR